MSKKNGNKPTPSPKTGGKLKESQVGLSVPDFKKTSPPPPKPKK